MSLSSFQRMTAKEHAEFLMKAVAFPEMEYVKALHKALKAADEEWVRSFQDSEGMVGIGKVCLLIAFS